MLIMAISGNGRPMYTYRLDYGTSYNMSKKQKYDRLSQQQLGFFILVNNNSFDVSL